MGPTKFETIQQVIESVAFKSPQKLTDLPPSSMATATNRHYDLTPNMIDPNIELVTPELLTAEMDEHVFVWIKKHTGNIIIHTEQKLRELPLRRDGTVEARYDVRRQLRDEERRV